MLLDSLDRHPDLYGFPRETRLIPYLLQNLCNFGDLRDDRNFLRLWNRVRDIPAFRVMNGGRVPPLPANWAEFPRELGSILDAVFGFFAAQHEKVRWIEKTPQHVQHLEGLHRLFSKAKFIHLIRDGRACAASLQKRWYRTPELTIYRWRNVVSLGRAQGRELTGDYFELKYEDLTSAPEHWMRQICQFLSIPFQPDVLGSRHPQSERRGTEGRIEPNTKTWQRQFGAEQVKRLENISGAYLAELGYPVVYSRGSETPSAWSLRYWNMRDYLRQFMHEVTRRRKDSHKKAWAFLLQLPALAFKQSRTNRY